MLNNVSNLNTSNSTKELNVRTIGNINITVYAEESTNYPIYYILPDKKELMPIVDLLDNTLTNHGTNFLKN